MVLQTDDLDRVHRRCDAAPGEGLGACVPEGCDDPLLRVEAQVFLVVNDPETLDFTAMDYGGTDADGLHQAKMIPATAGEPVLFRGSTTGPSCDQSNCSPVRVTWSVRQLVTAPELLSPIG